MSGICRHRQLGWLGFGPPRWHRGKDVGVATGMPYLVQLMHDGRAWLRWHDDFYELEEPVGKGSSADPFEPSSIAYCPRSPETWVVIHEPKARRAWRLDVEQRTFHEIELPGGDRLVKMDWTHGDWSPEWLGTDSTWLFRGEKATYAEHEGGLVEVTSASEEAPDRGTRDFACEGQPWSLTVRAPASNGRPAFEHELRPRTFGERLEAAIGITMAAVQPPLSLLRGRPLWMILSALLMAALTGLAAWRRLGRLGAPTIVRRYWAGLGLLCGPLMLVPFLLLEPARAWRQHPVETPPAPRISTSLREAV